MNNEKDQPTFGPALGRIASGLFILTVRYENKETGLLASWIQQCSFEPPLIMVAVRQGRYVADWLQEGTSFTVNILDESQTDMIAHFGKGFDPGEDAFAEVPVSRESSFAPVLSEALAYLDCKVVSRTQPGDHVVFFGQVENGKMLNDGQPMVHVRKSGLHY